MSIWQNLKKFARPYSDDEYDEEEYDEEMDEYEEDEAPQQTPPRSRRTSPFATEEGSAADASADSASSASSTSSSAGADASAAFSNKILNTGAGKQEVVLFHAKSFDDAAKAADELRKRKAVILNMENIDKALTRRVVDFLSGSVYALDGSVKKIAQSTYLFCPHNMTVVGDLENLKADAENYI